MKIPTDSYLWAQNTFGQCNLGDPRRSARLIDYAARQVQCPDSSIVASCKGDSAAMEGAYRFLRNPSVNPNDIDAGVYASTVQQCEGRAVLLVIQDTTSVEVAHKPLRQKLAQPGSPTGFVVHTALAVDGRSGIPIGVLEQSRWIRPRGKADPDRTYQDKESFKWEAASNLVHERLGEQSRSAITVCDREADLYEYLEFLIRQEHRFVIRSSDNRRLPGGLRLWDEMAKMKLIGYRQITIGQRGPYYDTYGDKRAGRPKRDAKFEVRAARISISRPGSNKSGNETLSINAIYVREIDVEEGQEPLEWRLFTTEPIDTIEQASTDISYYEKRWLIEEFHKSWKTGCRVETRPFQDLDNVERFLSITMSIGVRLLQLKACAEEDGSQSCERLLSPEEWQCLYSISENKPPPDAPPTIAWAQKAIARLAGWNDSKGTGRIGWQTMWQGWAIFQNHLVGWRAAKRNQPAHFYGS